MSSTGLEVFDKTVQTTNIWLGQIMDELGPDRQRAYNALRAVLHALRDRLPLQEAAHLSAQLPMLIRGIYFEGWRPQIEMSRDHKQQEFLERVGAELQSVGPINLEQAARAVFGVLARQVSGGEINDVKQALPKDIRDLWPAQEPAGPQLR